MQTIIANATKENLAYAKQIIFSQGLVAFPTETVYGLGGLGTSKSAVQQIYKVKGRPQDNPLIAHVHKDYDIEKLIKIEQSYVHKLISSFMPGPLTIVSKSLGVVTSEATCGLDSLAVRIPMHSVAQQFLAEVDAPIVAPSANISKHTSPVTVEHVYKDFNQKIPLILQGGKCSGGIESTVLNVMGSVPIILRAGLVTKEMIANIAGDCLVSDTATESNQKVMSPGVKYTHYRPNCDAKLFNYNQLDLALQEYNTQKSLGRRVYFLCDSDSAKKLGVNEILCLGTTETEMASNLYYRLREGEEKADLIIGIMPKGEGGVFEGVKNRLRKACI